jgi:hypothetical protein
MNPSLISRAALAYLILVLGSLQAWDSDVYEAGLLIVPAAMGLIFYRIDRAGEDQ